MVFLVVGALWRAPEPWANISTLAGLAVVPACARVWALSSVQARDENAGWKARHVVASLLGLLIWAGVIASYVYPEPEEEPYGDYDQSSFGSY